VSELADKPGTKYECAVCGGVVIVVKAGEGQLKCHGQPMKVAS
jgi:desulfoferrodoxin-like iron-binding protein